MAISHPWLNARCIELIRAKHLSEGTDDYPAAAQRCSAGILLEYEGFIRRTRCKMSRLRRGSKAWRRLSVQLMHNRGKASSIPALKDDSGTFIFEPEEMSKLLAHTFESTFSLPQVEVTEYTDIVGRFPTACGVLQICTRTARQVLRQLRVDSATGPDGMASRVLKECCDVIATPLALLGRRIVELGEWPRLWCEHWVVPLFKRSRFIGLSITEACISGLSYPKLPSDCLLRRSYPFLNKLLLATVNSLTGEEEVPEMFWSGSLLSIEAKRLAFIVVTYRGLLTESTRIFFAESCINTVSTPRCLELSQVGCN